MSDEKKVEEKAVDTKALDTSASTTPEGRKKDIAAKVEHDVKVASLGSKHPDHNPSKGVIVQTPSKETIEDIREQSQRRHETDPGPADWRNLPENKAKESKK